MPRFAANLSFLYPEYAFMDRFAAAARDGFRGVEYLFPYAVDADEIASVLHREGLEQVLFNAPPGDWDAGDRGIAALPGREKEFRDGILEALAYADTLGNKLIHVMAGLVATKHAEAAQRVTFVENLRFAATKAAESGRVILIEPINRRDMPDYFLTRQEQARAILNDVSMPNVKVQMDLYHAQVVEGDLETTIRQWLPTIGHVQIAGVPSRNEPDQGEVNFAYLLRLMDRLGYAGWVGCEYRPRAGTSAGLGWMKDLF